MDEQEDERTAQIDEALRRSQQQERDEAAHDLRRQADTDEAIVAALTREQERQQAADAPEPPEDAPPG
ncbi:hypothetical protein [uncultured Jatrophihabitans sp.]|uniref:hypothetical protein n=1 Tax=uncultured Jatrophihabitans sp. TaxID=1610747 RepID=UPI0035CAAE54